MNFLVFNLNQNRLSLAQHEVWEPDIRNYNSITHENYYGNTNFLVEPNGNVIWVPPSTFKVFCDSNLRYWPYDSHRCNLHFGSWVHNGHEIDIEAKETDSHLELFVENPEWEVIDFTVGRSSILYACCPEPYVDVRYNITITRRSSIYHTVIVAPAFVVMILTLTTFLIPANYGEKIIFNGLTALIVILFLLYFSQKLSVMATHTPLIGNI